MMARFYNQLIRYSKAASVYKRENFITSIFFLSALLFVFSVSAHGECFDFEGGDMGEGWIDCTTNKSIDPSLKWVFDSSKNDNGLCSLMSNTSGRQGEIVTYELCRYIKRPDNVEAPYYINFSWKSNEGTFIFYDNDRQEKFLSGGVAYDWTNETYPINDDEVHQIKWIYSDMGFKNAFGWLDHICIGTYDNPPIVNQTSPVEGGSFSVDDLIKFDYNASDDKMLEYCVLLIENKAVGPKNESLVGVDNYTLYYNITTPGEYNWSVRCCDNRSQCATSSVRRISIYDPTPTVELIYPQDGENRVRGELELKYRPSDNNLKNCTLFINERSAEVNTNPANGTENCFKYPFDKPGIYRWSVECCDNSSQCTFSETWTINITKNEPPRVNLTDPGDNDSTHYVNQTIYFNFTPKDDKKLVNCTLFIDGTERGDRTNETPVNGVACALNWTFEECGHHNWTVICRDNESLSNDGPIRDIFIKADEHPIVGNASPIGGEVQFVNQTINFEYTPTDDCGIDRCVLYIDESERDRNGSPSVGSVDFLRAEIPQPGNHTWKITCWDNSGNSNLSDGTVSIIRPSSACVYQPSFSQCELEGYDVKYTNISDAIRDILPEGNIKVMPGNYSENLVIDKPLHLKGIDKPIIYGKDKDVLCIKSSNVTIDGFNITGVNLSGKACILIPNVACQISHIYLINNYIGNYTLGKNKYGIFSENASNLNITNNTIFVFANCEEETFGIEAFNSTGVAEGNNIIHEKMNYEHCILSEEHENTCSIHCKKCGGFTERLKCSTNGMHLKRCNNITGWPTIDVWDENGGSC